MHWAAAGPALPAWPRSWRCLVNQVEVIQDLYWLDLADDWRGRLEERRLEDTDSDMLYQNAMDGFEDDVEPNTQLGLARMELKDWFEPFNDSHVPAFVHRPRTTRHLTGGENAEFFHAREFPQLLLLPYF